MQTTDTKSELKRPWNHFQTSHLDSVHALSKNVWAAEVSVRRNKVKKRGSVFTHMLVGEDYQSCFLLVSLVAGSQRLWLEISQSCHCIFGDGGEERDCLNLGVNAAKMVELAYLHAGSAQGDYRRCLHVTGLTASSCGGFWRLPLMIWAGPAFNTALSF